MRACLTHGGAHSHVGPLALRTGVGGAFVLTVELALMTAAVAVYGIALAVNTPSLANAAKGPLGLISTTAKSYPLASRAKASSASAAMSSLGSLVAESSTLSS